MRPHIIPDAYSAVLVERSKLFINPRFAQFESVFFGLFLGLESSRVGFDSFDFYCLDSDRDQKQVPVTTAFPVLELPLHRSDDPCIGSWRLSAHCQVPPGRRNRQLEKLS
jgi:hypothetical protein